MEFAKPLRTLAFSHSNNFLALGGDEGVLYVLSVPSRSIVFNTIFNGTITTVAFSRHDERLAIASKDGVLTLLCPDADWEPVGELDYSESPILAQDWASKVLAVGREDGSVAIFDTEKAFGNFFVPLAELSHSLPVRTLAFGAAGRFLGKENCWKNKHGSLKCSRNCFFFVWQPLEATAVSSPYLVPRMAGLYVNTSRQKTGPASYLVNGAQQVVIWSLADLKRPFASWIPLHGWKSRTFSKPDSFEIALSFHPSIGASMASGLL